MMPKQFQQHQQEQQQAFFRWQQSQVLNCEFQKKGGRKKTKSKTGKNVEDETLAAGRWLPVEKEMLAACYMAFLKDNNVERSQKHETFWYRVLNKFNSKIFQKRTKDMLTSKWHTLNANCQKFNTAYKKAKRLGKNGETMAFEAQAENDRTLMRLEELRILATSTNDLDDDDAYRIKKEK
nr:hypothetical protein [Tanacetum cinerariifolium]